ncbi:hypothetical protein B0A50_00354 [Salinomyces thailandicus]|uniref:Uncharacterized protein n=1 Tax=Salinomyces thailandicus TaxID=706561 RepID=A0A4U0UH79_9PEZI|nr:hypothetical protein B0A50_00354 [Salinomyces thailandica]
MSSFLLFCVATIPVETINTLLRTPRHNFFLLVRDTSSSFDAPSSAPPVQPFDTGFVGFSRERIRSFVDELVPDTQEGHPGMEVEPGQYCLLDEQSANNNTVVFGKALSSLHDRDPEAMTEDESEQWLMQCEENPDAPKDLWREYRVKFEEAESLSTILSMESDFTQKLYNDQFVAEHTNADGVFTVGRAQRAFEGSQT